MASEIDISALMASQSRWEIAEYALSGLVAAGCLGEFVHECIRWFDSHSFWRKSGGAASALLLVAALAVEIPTQFKVNSISGTIVTELSRREAETRIRAAEIERKYAWRTVQPDEAAKFNAALTSEKFPVVLEFETGDPEAFEYADQVFKLLRKWNPDVTPYNTAPLSRPRGINLNGTPEQGRDKMANALTAAGLQFREEVENRIGSEPTGVLRLSIGGRFPATLP